MSNEIPSWSERQIRVFLHNHLIVISIVLQCFGDSLSYYPFVRGTPITRIYRVCPRVRNSLSVFWRSECRKPTVIIHISALLAHEYFRKTCRYQSRSKKTENVMENKKQYHNPTLIMTKNTMQIQVKSTVDQMPFASPRSKFSSPTHAP